jgi:two-component system, OmpR family, phosphate regulon sensor histidine kinase PhoR
MFYLLYSLAGLIIGGLASFSWFQFKNTAQLQTILNLINQKTDDNSPLVSSRSVSSRPVLSQLRRSAVRLNNQLQEKEEELKSWQALCRAAPIGYLQLNANNQILWCNTQAQQLLHLASWPPDKPPVLLAVVRSFELDQLISQTRKNQVGSQLEWQLQPNYSDQPTDGLVTTIKAFTVPLPQKAVGIFLENRQPLVAMNKAQERWTTDLAHELRTPLTSLRLMTETIQNKVEPSLQQWTDRMIPEIDRLTKLVQGFLELNQLQDTYQQQIKTQPIQLDQLIEDAWNILEPLAHQKSISCQQTGDTNFTLLADPVSLTQVLINIFDNAIRYSPDHSQIQVITRSQAQLVEIDIIDAGHGFNPQDLERVFDRLFRSDPSRHQQNPATTITTGSGLGLAIVKQIILAHGGIITAKNHPETGGGWLQIQLPTP